MALRNWKLVKKHNAEMIIVEEPPATRRTSQA
jgi:hypothetical protein